jgi:hypothetical protein
MTIFKRLKFAFLVLFIGMIFMPFAYSKEAHFLILNYHDIIDEEDIEPLLTAWKLTNIFRRSIYLVEKKWVIAS